MNGVKKIAFDDMRKELNKIDYHEKFTRYSITDIDSWYVHPEHLNNKETRILNKLLGLRSVNYFGDKMNRQKKNI